MSHYYNEDADACHTITGANGKERATTLRDAKKHGWYPSVSTILGILDKPGLLNWKYRHITYACLEYAFADDPAYDPEMYNKIIVKEAFDKVKDAQDVGTQIHAALENYFSGKKIDPLEIVELPDAKKAPMRTFVDSVEYWVDKNKIEFDACELRLVNTTEGYAGTTDAAITKEGTRGLLDFKSTKTKEGVKVKPYPEQVIQLAAYHIAHYGEIRTTDFAVNVYISTTEPGRVEATFYTSEELVAAYYEGFRPLCQAWQYLKKYKPGKS